MVKRRLLLGGLIAGAFLLPSVASAGVVTGACVLCHTMHNSQNNATMNGSGTGNSNLLMENGCVGCHTGVANDVATGKAVSGVPAPQVGETGNYRLSGGYFPTASGNATDDAKMHTVTGGMYAAADTTLVLNIPGTGGTRAASVAGGFTCSDCHNATGGHHNTSAGYRMLTGVTGTGQADYGVLLNTTSNGNGERSLNQYDSTMNDFCASCHGGFHTPNQGVGGASGWLRHPTGNAVTYGATNEPSIVTKTTATDIDEAPIGAGNIVLCISCHVPHGSSRADLLAFNYNGTDNIAGGSTASIGCETCHSYNSTGM